MGNEIVYCIGCSARIGGSALEKGNAYRVDDQVCCAQCVEEIIADLPAGEQEKILNQHKKTAPIRRTTKAVPVTKATDRTTGRITKKITTGGIKKATGKVPTQSVRKTGAIAKTSKRVPKVEEDEFEDEGEEESSGRKKKILILSLSGGGGLLLLIVILVFALGGKDAPPDDPLQKKGPPTARIPKAPKAEAKNPEEEAKALLLKAIELQNSNASDFAGRMGFLRKAAEVSSNTPMADTIEGYIQGLLSDIETEAGRIVDNTQQNFQAQEYGTVLSMLRDAIERHDLDEWRTPLQTALDEKQAVIDAKYQSIKDTAVADKKRGNQVAVQQAFQTLTKWKLSEYVKKLQTELSEVKAVAGAGDASNPDAGPDAEPAEEKELTEAVKAYREQWELAMGAAFGRKYEEAIGRLEQARDDAGDDDAKKEAEADIKSVKQVAALRKKALGLLAGIGRLKTLSVKYEDFPKEYKEVSGIVIQCHGGQRLEFKAKAGEGKSAKDIRVFVELDAIRGSSLAKYVIEKGGELSADDLRASGLIALIEGEPEAAKQLLGNRRRGIPARYWEYAKVAQEKAPSPDRLEFQARKLFHRASIEWEEIRTWGPAMEKYRMLNNDYALAKITQQNLKVILKRMGMGKEYLYFPGAGIVKSGSFELADVAKATEDQALKAYQNPKDVEEYRAQVNYVDFKFYALPDHAYKIWVFAGACCLETFYTYFQSSEYKIREGGETVVLDPGSDYALPIPKMYIRRIKKEHKDHKGEKEPTRWAWIQIPTPREYQAPGPKGVRLYNDQKGFSVAYALISSSRKSPPTPDEAREFVETFKNLPKSEKKSLGTPEPGAWLLAGPFDSKGGLNAKLPPETKFDATAEMDGKGGKKITWKETKPALRNASGGKVAVFDFKAALTPNTNVVAYAAVHVNSPKAQAAVLYYGADDKSRAFVNGQTVHTNNTNAAVKIDGHKANIRLKEGWNRILIKVSQGSGEWGLAARITDAKKQPIPGLLYHPYGDLE